MNKEEIFEEIYKVFPYCNIRIDDHWNGLYKIRTEFFYRGNRLGNSMIIRDKKDVPILISMMFESIAAFYLKEESGEDK